MKKHSDMSVVPIPFKKALARIFAQLIGFALTLIPPFFTQYIVDTVIGRKEHIPVFWLAAVIVVSFAIHLYSYYFINYKSQIFSNGLASEHNSIIGRKVGSASMPAYEKQSKSKVLNLIAMDVSSVYSMASYVTDVPANIVKIVVVFALLFHARYELALIALFLAPLYILSSYTNKSRLELLACAEAEAADAYVQELEGIIGNKVSITLHKAVPYLLNRFEQKKKGFFDARNRKHFYLLITQELPRFITTLAPLLILVAGGNFVVNGSLTLGTLLLCIQLIGHVFEPLTEIATLHADIMSQKPVFQRAKDFMALPDEGAILPQAFGERDAICMKEVSLVRPDKTLLFCVKDFSAQGPGLILIKGGNGSGKTTLFNILSGVFSEDQIEIGEGGAYHIPARYREKLGYLYYPDFIFPGTVADNVTYGRDISKSELAAVFGRLDLPDADKLVSIKPENLSLGEKQKIYLARLFLGDFECLFLDEPNSNLDTATEDSLVALIAEVKRSKLVLVISHDERYNALADKIYRIQDGVMSSVGG